MGSGFLRGENGWTVGFFTHFHPFILDPLIWGDLDASWTLGSPLELLHGEAP